MYDFVPIDYKHGIDILSAMVFVGGGVIGTLYGRWSVMWKTEHEKTLERHETALNHMAVHIATIEANTNSIKEDMQDMKKIQSESAAIYQKALMKLMDDKRTV